MQNPLQQAARWPGCRQIMVRMAVCCCLILLQQSAVAQGTIDRQGQSAGPSITVSNPEEGISRQVAEESLHAAQLPQQTLPGGPVSSIASDPLMSNTQEQRLREILLQHDSSDWTGYRVVDLYDYLDSLAPTWLERTELELLGIDPQAEFQRAESVPFGTLMARLDSLLEQFDICVEIRKGRFEITSVDAAGDHPTVRLYDVTPLVVTRNAKYSLTSLENLICQTIAPDSWLVAGGTNTIIPFVVDGANSIRVVLVIASTTREHFEVHQLLDRLNSLTKTSLSSPSGSPSAVRSITSPMQSVDRTRERFDDRVHHRGGY